MTPTMHEDAKAWAASQRILAEIKQACDPADVASIEQHVAGLAVDGHLAVRRARMVQRAGLAVLWIEAIDRRAGA